MIDTNANRCAISKRVGHSSIAVRTHTGLGESIFLALSDVALATAGSLGFLADAQLSQVDRPRIGNHLYGGFARDFPCSDGGRLMVVALTDRHWRQLVAMTEIADVVTYLERALGADFTVEGERYEHREVLAALVERWFATHTTAQASAALAATSILWSQFRTFTEAVAHIQAEAGVSSSCQNHGFLPYF